MSHSDFRVVQNSSFPRCVDGRKASVIVAWDESSGWQVLKRASSAELDEGPQFLGGSLLFVKVLEEIKGFTRTKAFELVEKASTELGWGLQVHLDDRHGDFVFDEMSDKELVALVEVHHSGCGFAQYAWGDEADAVIIEAKRRHWRLQLLSGEHEECGAVINQVEGQTFDTAAAVIVHKSQFNTDLADAALMFEHLADKLNDPEFKKEALEWTTQVYIDVVISLKGVNSVQEILDVVDSYSTF